MSNLHLELRRDMPQPAGRIFDAWLDPALLARFMAPTPGWSVPEVRSDAQVGGQFRIVMRNAEGKDVPHHGEYRVIERPARLVFTWVSPHSIEGSEVTLTLEPLAAGGTRVRLRQVRFAGEGARDGHLRGWSAILEALAAAL